jgi:uncharacterized protein
MVGAGLRQPPAVEAYGGGGFLVEGSRFQGSILILDDVARPWSVTAMAELTPSDFDAAIAAGPGVVEFVLLGAGPAMSPPPKAVRMTLQDAGVGLEIMDTPAAVRLYNILAQDGRRVAAALIAV